MNARKMVAVLLYGGLLANVFAHHDGDHSVTLNTNNTWSECAMVISPDLTQTDFRDFGKDGTPMMYFRPNAGAKSLGKGHFDIGLTLAHTSALEDYKPKWNNTYSHPTDTHYLVGDNHLLRLPMISARVGITDNIDVEALFTKSPGANYGWFGLSGKYAFYNNKTLGMNSAARVSYVSLIGVDDFQFNSGSADLIISKDVWRFRPYAGIALLYSHLNETTTKVNLSAVNTFAAQPMIGTQFTLWHIGLDAEYSIGAVNMFSVKLSAGL